MKYRESRIKNLGVVSVAAVVSAVLGGTATSALAQQGANQLEEIVVTATRRAESIQNVPISITAFSQEQMDVQGVKQVDDIARLSPSVQFSRNSSFGSSLGNSISIRGMGADAGPATTGIYVDDTPIQVGATISSGSFTDNAYPMLFDIERVEVLNGPQGTLFGSGSEGGAVRFITPSPNMSSSSLYTRSELSTTTYGGTSYEVGVAGGAPLVQDVLGFRASVWTRHTGGYVDWVDWYTGDLRESNYNQQDAISARLAFGWQPVEGVMITPSFYYQKTKTTGSASFGLRSDNIGLPFNQPWGDVSHGDYADIHQLNQWGNQRFFLPALKIDWALPHDMELFSNTSYFRRKQEGVTDFASLESAIWANAVLPPQANWTFPGDDTQGNKFFTQELRLQSSNPDARLKWLVGAFYSDNETTDSRDVANPWLGEMVCGGMPASLCAQAIFGIMMPGPDHQPSPDGIYTFMNETILKEKQKAIFGNIDYRIVGGLSASVGLRYSKFDTEWTNLEGGPITGVDWPGADGEAELGTASASIVIPKFMLQYKTDNTLTYASASKGFRNGGVNAPLNNAACQRNLNDLGLNAAPTQYDPDKLWSYELGTKLQMLDHRLVVNAAVFMYDWSDMISNQYLPECTLSFTRNLGKARGTGFELAITYRPIDSLTLSANAGANRMKSTMEIRALPTTADPQGQIIIKDGSVLGGSSRINGSVQYNFDVAEHRSYLRADYTYTGPRPFENDPDLSSYQEHAERIFRPFGLSTTDVRLGMLFGGWDLSLFSQNVFNAQPLYKNRATVGGGFAPAESTQMIWASTIRPRTTGITATYRY